MAILTSVTSSEPDNGPGDGDTIHDIQDAEVGTSDFLIKLRAERSARGAGRIYTAVYTAMDGSGNMASAEAYAVVPHDQGGMSDPMAIGVAESTAGTVVAWGQVPEVQSYSVIRGQLSNLRDVGSTYDLGSVYCIETRGLDESTAGAEDFNVPRPGRAFFYLVEFNFADGSSSTYGTESAAKPRTPAAGACE